MSVFLGSVLAFAAILQTSKAPPTPGELEAEVLLNVLNQPLGDGTVADLALPEEFLRRVADRIVRGSYEERYRIVVKSAEEPAPRPAGIPPRTTWIAVATVAVALFAVGWASIAKRKERCAP